MITGNTVVNEQNNGRVFVSSLAELEKVRYDVMCKETSYCKPAASVLNVI